MALGGHVVQFQNGRLALQPFPPGAFPAGGRQNQAAFAAQRLLADMQRAASTGGYDPNVAPYQALLLTALAGIAQQGGAGSSFVGGTGGGLQGLDPNGYRAFRLNGGSLFDWEAEMNRQNDRNARNRADARRSLMGVSTGGGLAGSVGPFGTGYGGGFGGDSGGGGGFQAGGGGGFEIGGGGGGGESELGAVLNDSGLTVEDKITLMIMLIMKKMDKDIEDQARKIDAMQQQQNRGQANGGTGGGGSAGNGIGGNAGNESQLGGGNPSTDTETLKLKRLVDKRSQMFDMLRQIIDKYNQTAKGIIDSIGR
jgi:hypothetical protein